MTYKVGAKGQVVLPKELRERHGIAAGDEVVFDERDDAIVVRKAESRADVARRLRGFLRDDSDPTPLTARLEAEHRREVEEDERRMRERGLR
jgi:AbrB family looped-hinge helix DNA binding protein